MCWYQGRGACGEASPPGCNPLPTCQSGGEFRVWDLGLMVWGVGVRVWGLGCGVWGSGFGGVSVAVKQQDRHCLGFDMV